MPESLGSATLELDVDLTKLERNLTVADRRVEKTDDKFAKLERQAGLAERAINKIRMEAGQAGETDAVAERVKAALAGIRDQADEAHGEIKDVKLAEAQATETEVAGRRVESTLDKITRKANEARRALLGARLAGAGAGGGGGGRVPVSAGNPGRGFGPFGSGFGRIGLLGAAVGGATLLGPAAGPGALGLLAGIPTLAAAGAGALGTLALGFAGVGKAIGGDLKAFKALQPAQQQFVTTVRSLKGWVDQLRELAGESLFPGLTKGLKAALSPSTLGVIAAAVKDFGSAIGAAGAQWGKYFGSAEFANIAGPLFQAGAKTLSTMSGAALSLFDSLGVLGRAAIPLTRWLTDSAAAGARVVDSFARAQDASGGLGRALGEAQTSLRLVADLGLSALRVFGALGQALYPVSKVAVRDLTDGLNALAGILDRNRAKITEIVGGALAALRSTVETVTPLLTGMAKGLDSVAEAIGGWKVAFELVIGGYLASKMFDLATSFTAVGTAAGESGAAMGVGQLASRLDALKRIGPIAIGITVGLEILDSDVYKQIQKKVQDALGPLGFLGDNIKQALSIGPRSGKKLLDIWNHKPPGNSSAQTSFASSSSVNVPFLFAQITGGRLGVDGVERLRSSLSEVDYNALLAHARTKVNGRMYGLVGTNRPELYLPEYVGDYDVPVPNYNYRPPFTKNTGPKGPKPSVLDLVFPQRMQAALSDARANAAGGSMSSLQRLLAVAKKSLDYLNEEHRTGKKLVVLNRERATIAALIATTEQKIYRLQIAIPQRLQDALANAKAALSLTTSSPDSAASLTARAAALGKIVTAEDAILDRLKKQHVTGTALAALQKEIGQNETARGKALGQLQKVAVQAGLASEVERINGIGSGPAMSGQIASLRQRERSILDKVLRKQGVPDSKISGLSIDQLVGRATPFLSKATRRSLGVLGKDWQFYLKHDFLPDSVIDNVRTRLQQFNETVTSSFGKLNLSAAQIARREERQFLDTFQQIVSSYAPNAAPTGQGSGVMATHLYDIKHETRQQTKAMRKIADRVTASASDYMLGLGGFR